MTDRSIVLRLKAEISDFKRQMADAKKAAQGVGESAEDAAKRSKTAMGQMVQSATKNEEAWTKVGTSLLGIGVAAAAGVGIAVSKFADFDQAMSHVQAATHETAASMADLRDAAIEAGASTQYSATEAAGAIENLAKAGVDTADILGGGLDGALALAAAGTIEVADAAEIAATALTIFGLEGKDVTHVADLLAAGAGKAQGGVGDLGAALKQAGLVADQTGLSIEETVAGLSAFASAGLIGSDAGTSFKAMLQRLTPTSEEAAKEMERLGISAYDGQGQFIGLAKFAGVLQTALKDKTAEERNSTMATIFGSDAVRAASVLYEEGEQGIREWTAAVDDAGYAAETAALNTDNLRGDIERLGGAIDTALIKTGEASNSVLRSMTQALTGAVDAYGAASPVVQNFTLIAGAAVAAVGLMGGGFLVLAPRIIATRVALATLATDMPKVAGVMGGLGKAAGIAGAAFGIIQLTNAVVGLADQSRGALTDTEAIKSVILELDGVKASNLFAIGNGIDGVTEALDALMGDGLKQKLNQQASTLDTIFGTSMISEVSNSRKAFQSYDATLASLVQAGYAEEAAEGLETLWGQVDQSKYSIDDLKGLLPGYGEALAGVANQQTLMGESAEGMAAGVESVDPAITAASEAMAEWMKATVEADQSFINLGSAYDAIIQKNTDIATSTADATEKTTDSWNDYYDGVSVSAADYIAQLQAQVDAQAAWETNMVDLATRARDGMTGAMQEAAFQMIEELKALGPDGAAEVQLLHDMTDTELAQVVTLYQEKGAQAAADFAEKLRAIQNPVIRPTVDTATAYAQLAELSRNINAVAGKNVAIPYSPETHRAAGGMIYGPGTGTSDSIPARLSNGEYVIKASAVQQYGKGFFDNLNAQRFAVGGPVGSMPSLGRSTGDEAARSAPLIGELNAYGYDPQDAVRQVGSELRWAMAGRIL